MFGGRGEVRLGNFSDSLREYVPSQRTLRIIFVITILGLGAPIVSAYANSGSEWTTAELENRTVQPADGITVVTTDAFGSGRIAAYAPNGSTLYYNESYDYYHDVDPSPQGGTTVLYVASKEVSKAACHSEVECRQSMVERLNLTTGEVTRLWSNVRPRRGSSAIHDVDSVGDGKLLVAEIAQPDGVYVVNTRTGTIEWNWRAQQDFALESGGNYPEDFTHINDVERLDDGRIMASIRNMDQVVFLKPGSGVQDEWTLGTDDDHRVLFEQHNPDYIPEPQGGPAVIVADSENNRVVEYQRDGKGWEQSWVWQDTKLQWPRDVDRLPNGNTLITDTHGARVLEVNSNGEIAWSMTFPGPYEAERLGTGDESGNGSSAKQLGLESQTYTSSPSESAKSEDSLSNKVVYGFLNLLPQQALHGLLFLFPVWMTPLSALTLVGISVVGVFWILLELRWHGYGVAFSAPVRLIRRPSRSEDSTESDTAD